MPGAVRADAEFSKCVSLAEDELAVAEEACKFGRFAAADESLNRVESALDALRKARFAREQAERKAKEEAERVARERAESELKAKKEGGRAVPASRRGKADSSPPWEQTVVWRPPPLWPAPARSSASARRRSPCAGVRRDRS